MKLQNLIIIFLIIVIPVLLVTGYYINLQIKTMTLQNQYNIKLSDATKEAVEAFEINTVEWNNEYSGVADSKRRDIEASINTFTTSLANNLKISESKKQTIMAYVPAMAYTLYDGYYIYSPTEIAKVSLNERGTANIGADGQVIYVNEDGENTNERNNAATTYEHILKPFVAYTEILTDTDIVINYTLDNYIRIYGTINGEYQIKEGYLTSINPIDINLENLSEEIGYKIPISGSAEKYTYYCKEYVYVYDITGEKVYYDNTIGTDGNEAGWFTLNNEQKSYLSKEGIPTKWKKDSSGNLQNLNGDNPTINKSDYSAINYYKEANFFTNWVKENLGRDFLFLEIDGENNPENKDSEFYKHKIEVIKKSISDGLNQAISSYSAKSSYDFKMPVLKEEDWEQVLNNVSIITFLQGVPIGTKYYNNYAIATSTRNKEYVNPEEIYFIKSDDEYYHKSSREATHTTEGYTGYRNIDFIVRNIGEKYYYPHNQLACYNCIVNASSNINKTTKEYLTALARERYVSN